MILNNKNISTRKIAKELNMSHSVVSQVVHNKYKGSQETSKIVLDYIEFLKLEKEDLNKIIYCNPDAFVKGMQLLIKHPRLNDDETEFFIKLKKIVFNYKQKQDEQAKSKTTH